MRRVVLGLFTVAVASAIAGCAQPAELTDATEEADEWNATEEPITTRSELPTTTRVTVDDSLAWMAANVMPWVEEANGYLAELTAMPSFGEDVQLRADGRRDLCAEFGTRLDEWEASMSPPPRELGGAPEHVFDALREAVAACVGAPDDVTAAIDHRFSIPWGYLTGLIGVALPDSGEMVP